MVGGRSSRCQMAWVGTAVAGVLVLTIVLVGRPQHVGMELEGWGGRPLHVGTEVEPNDAYPVPKTALREYLDHTHGTSKLARTNPSMAAKIEGQDDFGQNGAKLSGKGMQSRLQALHLHQMVNPAMICFPIFVLVTD